LQGKHGRAFLPAVRCRFSQSREDVEDGVFKWLRRCKDRALCSHLCC